MKAPLDLAPITRHLRSKAASQLLVAAIHHLDIFEKLALTHADISQLKEICELADRPAMVLLPALRAMGLIAVDSQGKFELTELGNFLSTQNKYHITGYTGLEKDDPGVLKMASWLLNDGPEDVSAGWSFVKDEDAPSPMDEPASARFFTLALAGRARYLSPLVAKALPAKPLLLDVAGGTGYYTYEWLLANPAGNAILFDRPEVLNVAGELLAGFIADDPLKNSAVKDRVQFIAGDMLTDTLPPTDLLLAASLFHDWPENTCISLAEKFSVALKPGGELWVHDAFLNDELDGPLAVTDYSAMLFLGTRGRAYSRKEYKQWFTSAGLNNQQLEIPTLMDYGLISAAKPL